MIPVQKIHTAQNQGLCYELIQLTGQWHHCGMEGCVT